MLAKRRPDDTNRAPEPAWFRTAFAPSELSGSTGFVFFSLR